MWRRTQINTYESQNDPVTDLKMITSKKTASQNIPEESLNWAVSYADMLMVLLCFFIVFFSMENLTSQGGEHVSKAESTSSIDPSIIAIRNAFSELPTQSPVTSIGPEQGASQGTFTSKNGFVFSEKSHQLMVTLPDQIYRAREFTVSSEIKKNLREILDVLRPHKDSIRIVFIGHADSSPVTRENFYLKNNFDLSSLRASRALSYALEMGFDGRRLSISAFSSEIRNTRSLSLEILPHTVN